MHRGGGYWESGSNYFYIVSTLVTFVIPFLLLILPWFALLVQVQFFTRMFKSFLRSVHTKVKFINEGSKLLA
jgi:hypothetical protein